MRFIVLALVAAVFILSPNLLVMMGWHYKGGGPGFEKLHPVLFASVPVALLAGVSGRVLPLLNRFRARWSYLLLLVTLLAVLAEQVFRLQLVDSSGGEIGPLIDTLILPVLIFACLGWLAERDFATLHVMVRVIAGTSAVMGIYEQVTHSRILPRLIGEQLEVVDRGWRSIGLFGHYLTSALIAGLMILYLVTAVRGSFVRRLPEIALQVVALFTFGGRSSLVTVALVIALRAVVAMFRWVFVRGDEPVARYAVVAALVAIAAPVVLTLPFVQATMDRFENDRGSADIRRKGLDMLTNMSGSELLTGMENDRKLALMKKYDIPAIESAWGSWVANYGLPVTLLLIVAIFWWLWRLSATLDSSGRWMVLFFFITCTGSVTLGSKTLLLSIFVLMLVGLCRARPLLLTDRRVRGSRNGQLASVR